MVDLANLCMGCMELKSSEAACPACGYKDGTQPDSPLHLHPRTELHGQYLVGRVLGHGGFGVTYLGWDLNLERKIAIKEYLPSGVAVRTGLNSEVVPFSGETRKDFEYGLEKYLDEARTVARFQTHPSVVSVLNFFRANGTAYLVMEYLEGATFERYLDNHGGKAAIDTVLTVMVPVLEALISVHAQGILHRDISPDNIYITRKWQIKVLDFGAARYALGTKSRNLSVILKEGYAPVEQYHSKGNQGPWTDVYACGATIYRALTGKIAAASLDRMQGDDLVPPSVLGAEISQQQEWALLKALAVQPDNRFLTMQEFRDALTGASPMGAVVEQTGEKLQAPANPVTGGPRSETPKPVSGWPMTQKPVSSGPSAAPPVPPSTFQPGPARPQSGPQAPISRVPQKTSLPKWVWAAALGMLLSLGGVTVYRRYEEQQREAIAQKQREIARVRFEEEMKRQEELRKEDDRRREERSKQEAVLRQQQEELDRKQAELAEKDRQLEAQKQLSRQQQSRQQQQQQPQQQQAQLQQQNQNRFPPLNNQPQQYNNGVPQQQQQQQARQMYQQQYQNLNENLSRNLNIPPAQPAYDDQMRMAYAASRSRNYTTAIQISQQAIRSNPARPEAYANIGWVALYGSGDTSTALQNYREAINRGGIVWFRVNHDHGNLSFQDRCTGDLGIAKDRIEFSSQGQVHNFRIPKTALKEVQGNKYPFKAVSGDFHVKSNDGRNFNLISPTDAKVVRDMILQLANLR